MITIPERVDATWIASLGDKQLRQAEIILHETFAKEEASEKKRLGDRYEMMRGSASLLGAWMRWGMVNNEIRERGMITARRHNSRAK